MSEVSPTAELLTTIFGDTPRARILGATYDADDYLNRSELARRGGFDRSTLYRTNHLDELVQLGFLTAIRDGEQYQMTDDGEEALNGLLVAAENFLPH